MSEVSLIRLYVLHAIYLLIFVMVPQLSWVKIFDPSQSWGAGDSRGEVACMLAALSVLSALGVRYPLQMRPLLFWELVWKMVWMVRVALPLWLDGKVDDALRENSLAVGMGALLFLIIPWRYVFEHYIKEPGNLWKRHATAN